MSGEITYFPSYLPFTRTTDVIMFVCIRINEKSKASLRLIQFISKYMEEMY